MNYHDFPNWIGRIYDTRDEEFDCEQVQELLPTYVENKLEGAEQHWLAAGVRTHLAQCPDCNEVFDGLLYLTRSDVSEDLRAMHEDGEGQFTLNPSANASPAAASYSSPTD